MLIPSPSNLRIFVPSSSGDCVSVAPTANRRREAPTHAGPHGAGIAGRVACARCHSPAPAHHGVTELRRSEEHTSELQSLMRISYAVFCLKKKKKYKNYNKESNTQ